MGTLLDQAASQCAAMDLARVPPETIAQAGFVIADTVAVSRAGARQRECEQLVGLARLEGTVFDRDSEVGGGASGRATVFSSPLSRSSAGHAAFLNATAGSFLEMDEGTRPTGHPGMQVVTAAIAVAESAGLSGRDLLQAVLAGYELTSRLFRAFRLRYPVHPHGHLGGIGAALAVVLLDGTDPVTAVRIAATTPVLSVWDACYEGATARNTWMGLAAQTAVRASMLARAGFTGSADALEITFGALAGDLEEPDVMSAPLSYERLGIANNYFKLHSACALSHAAMDATFRLDLPAPERIERIVVETVNNNLKLDRQPQPNDLSARFSLPYAVATVATLGRSGPEAFGYRADVAQLATRVRVQTAPDLESQWPDASPARVTAYWDGASVSAEVANPHGYHSDPITEPELRQKFLNLVDDPLRGEDWWDRLTSLAGVVNCAELFTEEGRR